MQRVMIIGAPGSGKSTLARTLGGLTGLPVFHMDHIHHLPGWQQRPRAERLEMAGEIERSERWIFEGGLSETYHRRAERADVIVWLDLPLWLLLWRVARRIVRYRGTVRPDMAPGCPEQFDPDFFRYILTSDRRTRDRNRRFCEAWPDKAVRLRSPRAVARWLEQVRAAG
ncbi:hypothetical protein [Wenxinia saemankumensis]|uniref:Adenylate kinase n=1 Tax=Wenxinia saemankumensis TaxID=1447782 RepID=A0A1M6FUZ7_9RHOB|nr:hypothetical protein [Wenxinia saemankumensis]SHJ01459.1 Adenylate kinase [Wenxinia saemankumensis]